MNHNSLSDSIQRSAKFLIVIGLFIMTSWAAINNYYASFQGGLAWIEASKRAVSHLQTADAKHHKQLLDLISRDYQPISNHRQVYCRFELIADSLAIINDQTSVNTGIYLC